MSPTKSTIMMALFAGSALALPLFASARTPDPMDPVYACRNILEDAQRLTCFDAAVSELYQKHQEGSVQTVDTASLQQLERESFGFSMPSLPSLLSRRSGDDGADGRAATIAPEPVNEIVSPIRSARMQNISQRVIVTLENGQVWEQIDTTRVNSSTLRRASEARVRRAALGSFLLSIDGSAAFRVRRIS